MKKKTNLSRKDELFNDLVKAFKISRVDPSSTTVAFDGSYCLQVLTNAIWCITSYHLTINEARKQAKEVTPIPKLFEDYVGYNNIKRQESKGHAIILRFVTFGIPGPIFPAVEVLRKVSWVMENNIRWDGRFGRLSKQLQRVS